METIHHVIIPLGCLNIIRYRANVVTIEEQEALKAFWACNEDIIRTRIQSNKFYQADVRTYRKILQNNLKLFIDLTDEIGIIDETGKLKTFNGEIAHIPSATATDDTKESFIKPGHLNVTDLEAKADKLYDLVKYDLKNRTLIQ